MPKTVETRVEGAHATSAPLAELIARHLPEDGVREVASGVILGRASSPLGPAHGVLEPSFCLIAQGTKEIWLGEECYRYDPQSYLLISSTLPAMWSIVEASQERPYLSVVLALDADAIVSVLIDSGIQTATPAVAGPVTVSHLDDSLFDVVVRILRLLEEPQDYRVLAPLATRELAYRLLKGEQSDRVRQIGLVGMHGAQIAKAIERIRANYRDALSVSELARTVAMSVSTFHHHFKAVTGTSPLQFQKQLRLYEARRLLLPGDADAATVGYHVGYKDPSHFSRDYKRLFGKPPARDVDGIRNASELVEVRADRKNRHTARSPGKSGELTERSS
jgi:AraC-like DNA-binding protein